MQPDDLLQQFAVPDHDGVYLLGCRSKRITVHDQQVRALNLMTVLATTGRLKKDDDVAIVGAGIGGLTAAVAAGRIRACVDVIDERDEPIIFQRHSLQRFLHPGVYDWPNPGFERERTNFPLMNWRAGMASEVAKRLLIDWETEQKRRSIQYMPQRRLTGLARRGNVWALEFGSPAPASSKSYRIVILAIGFGIERHISDQPLRSYWRNEDLDSTPLDQPGADIRYLVAGSGDGALIDVLRTRLRDFRHDKLLTDLKLGDPELQAIREKLLEIEHEAEERSDPGSLLKREYERLVLPSDLIHRLRERARPGTHVMLVTRSPVPFDLKSSVLHRFLLSVLLRERLVEHQVGELRKVEGSRPRVTAHVEPALTTPTFYDVVVRIGREPALEGLPAVALQCARLSIPTPDPTREPIDWGVLNISVALPMSHPSVPSPTQIGYFVTSRQYAGTIQDRGFRECDLTRFPEPQDARALVLLVNLQVALARVAEQHASEGCLIEVHFQAQLHRRLRDGDLAPPRSVSFTYQSDGIEHVALADLDSILDKRLHRVDSLDS